MPLHAGRNLRKDDNMNQDYLNEQISITMTDLQSMIEAAARKGADEAVKA